MLDSSDPGTTVVKSDDGLASLSIPEGALPEGTDPSTVGLTKTVVTIEGMNVAAAYDLKPDGLVLLKPAALVIQSPVEEIRGGLTAFHLSGTEKSPKIEPVRITAGKPTSEGIIELSVEVTHFSQMVYTNWPFSLLITAPGSRNITMMVGESATLSFKYVRATKPKYFGLFNWQTIQPYGEWNVASGGCSGNYKDVFTLSSEVFQDFPPKTKVGANTHEFTFSAANAITCINAGTDKFNYSGFVDGVIDIDGNDGFPTYSWIIERFNVTCIAPDLGVPDAYIAPDAGGYGYDSGGYSYDIGSYYYDYGSYNDTGYYSTDGGYSYDDAGVAPDAGVSDDSAGISDAFVVDWLAYPDSGALASACCWPTFCSDIYFPIQCTGGTYIAGGSCAANPCSSLDAGVADAAPPDLAPQDCKCGDPGVTLTAKDASGNSSCGWGDETQCSGWNSVVPSGTNPYGYFPNGTAFSHYGCTITIHCP